VNHVKLAALIALRCYGSSGDTALFAPTDKGLEHCRLGREPTDMAETSSCASRSRPPGDIVGHENHVENGDRAESRRLTLLSFRLRQICAMDKR
jgi:hypothetical protein